MERTRCRRLPDAVAQETTRQQIAPTATAMATVVMVAMTIQRAECYNVQQRHVQRIASMEHTLGKTRQIYMGWPTTWII